MVDRLYKKSTLSFLFAGSRWHYGRQFPRLHVTKDFLRSAIATCDQGYNPTPKTSERLRHNSENKSFVSGLRGLSHHVLLHCPPLLWAFLHPNSVSARIRGWVASRRQSRSTSEYELLFYAQIKQKQRFKTLRSDYCALGCDRQMPLEPIV